MSPTVSQCQQVTTLLALHQHPIFRTSVNLVHTVQLVQLPDWLSNVHQALSEAFLEALKLQIAAFAQPAIIAQPKLRSPSNALSDTTARLAKSSRLLVLLDTLEPP